MGLSSAMVDVFWGFLNLVVGYLLVCRIGTFDLRSTSDTAALAFGALLAVRCWRASPARCTAATALTRHEAGAGQGRHR